MEYLLYVVIWIMGAVYGWYARERQAERRINRMVQEVEEQIEQEEDSRVSIVIEKHNDMFYIYNKANMEFMGQGKTKEEVEKILIKRYPGKNFGATVSNLDDTGFLS